MLTLPSLGWIGKLRGSQANSHHVSGWGLSKVQHIIISFMDDYLYLIRVHESAHTDPKRLQSCFDAPLAETPLWRWNWRACLDPAYVEKIWRQSKCLYLKQLFLNDSDHHGNITESRLCSSWKLNQSLPQLREHVMEAMQMCWHWQEGVRDPAVHTQTSMQNPCAPRYGGWNRSSFVRVNRRLRRYTWHVFSLQQLKVIFFILSCSCRALSSEYSHWVWYSNKVIGLQMLQSLAPLIYVTSAIF